MVEQEKHGFFICEFGLLHLRSIYSFPLCFFSFFLFLVTAWYYMVILKEPLKSKAIQGHLLQNSDANLEHFGTLTSFCREMKRWICVSLSYSVIYNINLKKSNMYMHPRLIRMSFNDFFLMNFRFLALFFLKIVKKIIKMPAIFYQLVPRIYIIYYMICKSKSALMW